MSAVEAIDWEEVERNRSIEIQSAYHRLIGLVIGKYNELGQTNPKLVCLAKTMAKRYHTVDMIDDLHYHIPSRIPISVVDGKEYPSVSFAVSGFVPLWALYLPRAQEAIELMKQVDEA